MKNLALFLLLLSSACAAPVEPEPLPPLVLSADELSQWGSETIPLPPGFAPELPSGMETLRFAPNWRDAETANFWSYAFAMRIDESMPDAARLDEILELYYDGLMAAVADGNLGPDPADAEVTQGAPNEYEARIQFPDAFGDLRPIDLRMVIDVVPSGEESTTLYIQASPQPKTHEIWRRLQAVVGSIELPQANE